MQCFLCCVGLQCDVRVGVHFIVFHSIQCVEWAMWSLLAVFYCRVVCSDKFCCLALCCVVLHCVLFKCFIVCCSVLQYFLVQCHVKYCSFLQGVAASCKEFQSAKVWCSVVYCLVVFLSKVQCDVLCFSTY